MKRVLAGLYLLTCGLLLAGYGQSRATQTQVSPGWQLFTPADHSFQVEMPGGVVIEHDPITSDEPFVGVSYTSMAGIRGADFFTVSVVCANKLKPPNFSPDKYFTAVFAQRGPGKQISIKPITVEGFSGRELVAREKDGDTFMRWIIAGPRIYILHLLTSGESSPEALAKRFFDSLHINRAGAELPGCSDMDGRLPVATTGTIRFLVFPEYWHSGKKGSENTLIDAQHYEIRSRRASLDEEWLFGAFAYSDSSGAPTSPESFARNFYAVLLSDPPKISSLSRSDWSAAKTISTDGKRIYWGDDKKSTPFEYRGHKYDKTAEHWGSVMISPGSQWVAIYSYSGQNAPVVLWSGGVPREGDLHWDVYDAETAEKVLSWTARLVGNPALLKDSSVWVGDRYLVMPFDSIMKACVIGILPSRDR